MQEIKFRGKSLVTGEWLCGSLVNNTFFLSNGGSPIPYILDTDKIEYFSIEDFVEYLDEFEVYPETVGQYTGLKDKNGKEIYEGDIISTDLDRPFNIVVFRNGAFMFQCHDNGKDYYDYMFSVDEESDRWEYGEVIGNIHDNPELLKGEENA